jgi:hypothetical protein
MRINNEHFRRTAQIGRAGGMIWMISITLLFEFYNLYFAQLSIFFTLGIAIIIISLSSILFYWSIITLSHARAMPMEKFVDEVKRRNLRRRFFIVLILEIIAFNIAPLLLLWFGHIEYIVPVEILICAIHFIPLARIFNMPVYYFLGSTVSLITILTIIFIPASSQIGNLFAIAAIPSLSFIILNLIAIVFILNDAKQYFEPSHAAAQRIIT